MNQQLVYPSAVHLRKLCLLSIAATSYQLQQKAKVQQVAEHHIASRYQMLLSTFRPSRQQHVQGTGAMN
jgi:hypothetical protein